MGCDGVKKNNRILVWFAAVIFAFAIPYVGTRLFLQYRGVSEVQISSLKSSRDVCIYQDDSYKLIDCEEYILFALAGIYDSDWEDEMVKTMAVVIRTAIYYEMNSQADTANGGGKIINESDLKEIRYDKSELKDRWGGQYKNNLQIVYNAVKDTMGQVITYNDKLIIPIYHEVSIGATISAEELYGTAVPYLVSVDSSQDIQAPDFSSTKIYSELRIKKEFGMNGEGEDFADSTDSAGEINGQNASGQETDGQGANGQETSEAEYDAAKLEIIEATKSGFVRSVNVFGKVVSGETFAEVLSLDTTNFHIDKVEEGYRIISIGKGNSIGMSVYGAAYKAKQGSTYDEIISYYYPETILSDGISY